MTSFYEELLQMCPSYLNNLFTNNSCNRTLRSAHNKQLPTFNTVKYGKRSIKYNGPQLWNSHPDGVVLNVNVDSVYHVKLCINNNLQKYKSMYLIRIIIYTLYKVCYV